MKEGRAVSQRAGLHTLWRGVALGTLSILFMLGVFQFRHNRAYGHYARIGVHLDLVCEASVSKPGRALYCSAVLSNLGLLPQYLSSSVIQGDNLLEPPQTQFSYAVERWDGNTGQWRMAWPLSSSQSKPVVSWGKTSIWPGSSVRVMDWQLIGESEGLKIGDLFRVAVLSNPADPKRCQVFASNPVSLR